MLGRILKFDSRLGYGTIEDDSGREHFFHVNNVLGSRSLSSGDIVSFAPHLDRRNTPTASAVRVLQTPEQHRALEEISEWKREASLEDNSRYFFYTDDVGRLVEGSRSYVIGRKGTGKTAIGEYLLGLSSYNIFTRKLSFKHYPFNELYGMANTAFKAPNQYITLCKYVIYSILCQMMIQNEKIGGDVRQTLRSLYPQDPDHALASSIKEWITTKISVSVLGMGGSVDVGQRIIDNNLPLSARVDLLEDYIRNNIDDSVYVIVFDELDEDYNSFDQNETTLYISLITSLFKACQNITSRLLCTGTHVRPILLLRDDIYAQLRDPDKAKWDDLVLHLSWHHTAIRNLLAFRISRAIDPNVTGWSYEEAWSHVFSPDPIRRTGVKPESALSYMTKFTLRRPRDYVVWLRESASNALALKNNLITSHAIRGSTRRISDYMRAEFEDELGGLLPEGHAVFDIISMQGKQNFTAKQFEEILSRESKRRNLRQRSAEEVLSILFEHSIIGTQSKDGKYSFRFMDPKMICRMDDTFVLHRGLYESLNLV